MRLHFILLIVLIAQDVSCLGVASDQDVVTYTKRLNVADLDPSLHAQRLDDWLSLGPARSEKVEWSKGDCDLKPDTPEPKEGYPLCVRVDLRRHKAWGWAVIAIGTTRAGIQGRPRVEHLVVTTKALAQRGQFRRTNRLSESPKLLSDVDDIDAKAAGK